MSVKFCSFLQDEARKTITKMLDELQFGRTEPIVRVNSVESGLAEDDIKTVMQANSLPPTWMIPKVDDALDIQWASFSYFSVLLLKDAVYAKILLCMLSFPLPSFLRRGDVIFIILQTSDVKLHPS